MTNSTWNLFEVEARKVGLLVEPTEVWLMGEACECRCKYMVLSTCTVIAHCKTIKQVEDAIAHERAMLDRFTRAEQPEQATYGGLQLRLL